MKEIIPNTTVNLSVIGGGINNIPGVKTEITNGITFVRSSDNTLNDFIIVQNYPNPFNPNTNIVYRITEPGFVSLKVYNMLAKEAAIVVDEEKSAGTYKVEFDASSFSCGFASGVNFSQLKFGPLVQTRKMIFLK